MCIMTAPVVRWSANSEPAVFQSENGGGNDQCKKGSRLRAGPVLSDVAESGERREMDELHAMPAHQKARPANQPLQVKYHIRRASDSTARHAFGTTASPPAGLLLDLTWHV